MNHAPSKSIYLVAGEASGDLHAANLVEALRAKDPSLRCEGLGGQLMQKAGVKLDLDFTRMAVVGFWEVIKHYGEFKKVFDATIARLQANPPDAVILIDYPGFNLRLARRIKELKIPTRIIYYISPQVWAWKAKRVFDIQKYVDRMLVIFEFEKDFYKRYGVDVDFVGHPLVDHARASQPRSQALASIGLTPEKPTLALMPGSRIKEVDRHLPIMLQAAEQLKIQYPDLQCVFIQAPTISDELVKSLITDPTVAIARDNSYNIIAACDACLVASGTATLEVALLETPMVVMYKTSWPTYLLARAVIKIPYISLVNIVAGKPVVAECLQKNASAISLAQTISPLLTDSPTRRAMTAELKDIRRKLGDSGAVDQTARRILEIISQSQHP